MAAAVYAALDLRTVFVERISVEGIEKRDVGYVYSMTVTWSNRKSYQIYRQYADVIGFKHKLEQLFSQHSSEIPHIPATDTLRKVFGLLNESTHKQRLELVDELCKAVIRLPLEVSHARIVTDFFGNRPGDITLQGHERSGPPSLHPMREPKGQEIKEYKVKHEFKAADEKQLDLQVGEIVLFLREDPNGWVCVGKPDFQSKQGKIGWVPRDFLEELNMLDESCIDRSLDYAVLLPPNLENGDVPLTEQYLAIASYSLNDDEESKLAFSAGKKLAIYEKSEDGWWLAELNGKCGWVPSTYLIRLEAGSEEQDACLIKPETYIVTDEHTAERDDEISLPAGCTVDVVMKPLSGWWQVTYNGMSGLVPATKLNPASPKRMNKFTSHRTKGTFRSPPRRATVMANAAQKQSLSEECPSSLPTVHEKELSSPERKTNSDTSELSASYDKPQMCYKKSLRGNRNVVYAVLKKSGKVPELPLASPPQVAGYKVPSNGRAHVAESPSPSVEYTSSGSSRSNSSSKVLRPQARATAGIRHSLIEDDDKVPRYTKRELMKVIDERNQLKMKLYSVFEELELIKEIVRTRNNS